jgi:hypothetical protein
MTRAYTTVAVEALIALALIAATLTLICEIDKLKALKRYSKVEQ